MGDDSIVAASVMLDKAMQDAGQRDDARAGDAAAVLTVAIVAARYCQRRLASVARALHPGHYLFGPLRAPRCNCQPPPAPTPESTGFRG